MNTTANLGLKIIDTPGVDTVDQLRVSINNHATVLDGLAVAGSLGVPAGSLVATARSSAPTGWLLCDGASLLRAAYPDLWAAIGTNYGSVDGTHFNVPDLRGRVPVGQDTGRARITGTAKVALGEADGEDKHLLTGPESGIAQHSHGINEASTNFIVIVGRGVNAGNLTASGTQVNRDVSAMSIQNAGPTNAASQHNNLQPYQIVNWIIKT